MENASFKLTDIVFKSINQKMHVSGIYCDSAKPFDCVNHEMCVCPQIFRIASLIKDKTSTFMCHSVIHKFSVSYVRMLQKYIVVASR
jgi:hypothetical protein